MGPARDRVRDPEPQAALPGPQAQAAFLRGPAVLPGAAARLHLQVAPLPRHRPAAAR